MIEHVNGYIWTIDWQKRLRRELPVLNQIIKQQKEKSTSKILDIGCGPGYHFLELKKQHPKAECIGIDISEPMIQYAQSLAEKEQIQIDYRAGNFLEEPEILRGEFDVIFSLGNSLSLIWAKSSPEHVLKTLIGHLHPEGSLFFQILNNDKPRKGYFASKIGMTLEGIEIFLLKRFEPNLPMKTMEVEFVTFQRKPEDTIYTYNASRSSWPLITSKELKELLSKVGFHEIQFWGNYACESYSPQNSESLLCWAKKKRIIV
ncbi:MAG: class I SAM-dependent methyltransferase [Promethearchaeota archaeon]